MDRLTKFNPIPVERKELILTEARERILAGDTLKQIATDHDITSRTLQTWLHQLGDEYKALRELWIDNLLLDASDAIDNATEDAETSTEGIGERERREDREDKQLRLALAREKWKKATWYAERRDSQRYGQKTEHKQDLSLNITVNRAIESSPVYEVITEELRNIPLKPA